jgi:hypothetical protein
MRRIIQANIDRFKELLSFETDQAKRAKVTRLLVEEQAKLAKLAELPKSKKPKPAF